jgi:hypothetical protein
VNKRGEKTASEIQASSLNPKAKEREFAKKCRAKKKG